MSKYSHCSGFDRYHTRIYTQLFGFPYKLCKKITDGTEKNFPSCLVEDKQKQKRKLERQQRKNSIWESTMFEYKCKILRIVDGDTVDVDIDLGFGIWRHRERVRLVGIDILNQEHVI